MSRLFLCPTSDEFAELYRSAADAYNRTPLAERNSGFDLFCDIEDTTDLQRNTYLIGQGCRAVAVGPDGTPRAYWLAPRSSISKTEWRLANSMGLIDATYRGVLKAALWSIDNARPTHALNGQRICQLATGDLSTWAEVVVVDELPGPMTERGEGRFGSTDTSKPDFFQRQTPISDEMCVFLGLPSGSTESRSNVSKAVTAYIRQHKLRSTYQNFKTDAVLSKLLNVAEGDEISLFNLQKHIRHHYNKK
jgi:dUTP pyrophosphatase